MRRILVTGASTWTGGRLVSELEKRNDVAVFAVDEIPPRHAFNAPFAELSLDRSELAHHVLDVAPDTIVHLLTVDRSVELGKRRAHEQAVIGAQALFGAIGRSATVRRVIIKSDAAVYRIEPRSPSLFAESTDGRGTRSRYGAQLADLEALVADLVPIHEHVTYMTLRLAPIFGATVGNPLSRFLSLRVVPTRMGQDPRLQMLHEDDAVAAFVVAIDADAGGVFNIGGGSPVYLSRVIRHGRRIEQPLPQRAYDAALRGLARAGYHLPGHVRAMLEHGIALDSRRAETELGFTPERQGREVALAAYERYRDAS
jgi:UDP-glucose 4-epimerase